MFCGHCGHLVPDTNNFCSRCGQPITNNFITSEVEKVFIIEAKTDTIDYTNHGELTAIFNRINRKRILIDLSTVQFIDSTGIGTIVTLYYKTNRTKQEIFITGVTDQVMTSIKALGVDNLFLLYESKGKAFAEWGILHS